MGYSIVGKTVYVTSHHRKYNVPIDFPRFGVIESEIYMAKGEYLIYKLTFEGGFAFHVPANEINKTVFVLENDTEKARLEIMLKH